MRQPSFQIGKRGALVLVLESGHKCKLGLRVTPNGFQVFDRVTRQWFAAPDTVDTREGTFSISVSFSPRSAV